MRRIFVLIAAMALVLSACGDDVGDGGPVTTQGGSDTTTTTQEQPTTTGDEVTTTTSTTTEPLGERFVTIYLIQDGLYAKAVQRAVPDTVEVAGNAIRALIAGPTTTEQDEGLSSSVPTDTLLLGLTIEDGLATIDLSKEFEQGGGSFAMLSRLAQVVYTLTEFDTVDRVLFWIDGGPREWFSGEGIIISDPVDRSDYESLLPLTPPAERWLQADLPDVTGTDDGDLRRVVLVTADDVLNVRSEAGVDNPIEGMLEPGLTVIVTGRTSQVGSSTWMEIRTPEGTGWVNGRYLGAVVDDADFVESPAVLDLLDRLSNAMAEREDLRPYVSERGLYVAHNAPPVRFERSDLASIMTDTATYQWGSPALEPGSPENPYRTFAEAVGDRFVSTFDDPDTSIRWDEVEMGGNGTVADQAIPFEFRGFHYVSVYDRGDNPEYGGLDWTAWYVSIDYEHGEPKVVGLTINEWAP